MRQVVVGPNRTNARFLDFTRHYGFEPIRHRPYRPRTKGKVERTVGYVRTQLPQRPHLHRTGRPQRPGPTMAGQRRQRPHPRHHSEPGRATGSWRRHLIPVSGLNLYQLVRGATIAPSAPRHSCASTRAITRCPRRFVGTRVSIEAGASFIIIRCKDLIVAEHPRATSSRPAGRGPSPRPGALGQVHRGQTRRGPPPGLPCHLHRGGPGALRCELYAEAAQ